MSGPWIYPLVCRDPAISGGQREQYHAVTAIYCREAHETPFTLPANGIPTQRDYLDQRIEKRIRVDECCLFWYGAAPGPGALQREGSA